MSPEQIATLAIVQGITEFLPISSSGHLVLVPIFFGWADQGLLIDVAVHVGTLGAVILYCGRDVLAMLRGAADWRSAGAEAAGGRRLMAQIIVATIPVVVAGAALSVVGTDALRSLTVIGWTTLLFGLLLLAADRWGPRARHLHDMTFAGALLIGIAQILALVPGTSRAGITMTAARALGYERTDSARFSMLLSIPTIIAAGALATREIIALGEARLQTDALIAAALAFASALVAIALMMRWLARASFTPFVVYRVILGVVLLVVAYR